MINMSILKTISINETKQSQDTNCFYFVMREDVILYIGKTRSIKNRFATHSKKEQFK